MAAVTTHSYFRAQEEKICHYFHLIPFYLPWSNGAGSNGSSFFLIFSFKPALTLSSFTLIKRLFSSSSLSAVRVVSSTYVRFLICLLPILIPAWNSSSLAFLMMWEINYTSVIFLMNAFPGFWLGKWQEELVWAGGCAVVILKSPTGCRWLHRPTVWRQKGSKCFCWVLAIIISPNCTDLLVLAYLLLDTANNYLEMVLCC